MSDLKKLCMGCMNTLNEDGSCSHCNYNSSFPYLLSYLPPKTVLDDRYIVGKLLSYNGESAVYIGYDNVTNEKVTIKEYMPDTLCSREKGSANILVNSQFNAQYKTYMQEFLELGKVLSRMRTLSHIVSAVDMFMQNNTAYVILEYIEAITLKQYIQDNAGELTWTQVKKMFPPIFTTMSLIHNAGIIHRGISPDTILVTDKGELKLTGFCISAVRTANTELASELYAGYTAPEQYSSNSWQGTWTDVYSIAAVLYRILTGCMPVEALSRISNDNLSEPAMINPDIPHNVSKVIMQALILSGNMRIQTVTEFVTKLFEQPEYMEQPRGATQVIPVQKPLQVKEDNSKPSNLPVIIGAISIVAVLTAALIILMILILPSDDDKQNSGISFSSSNSITQTPSNSIITSPTESVGDETSTHSSGNSTPYYVPNFIGMLYDNIKSNTNVTSKLTIEVTYDYNDEYENGRIFEQSIEPDTIIYDVEEIKIKVSLGAEFVEVPTFENMSKKDYLSLLDSLLIKYSTETVESTTVEPDYVVRTSINVGGKVNVKEGQILTVYIAVAPESSSSSSDASSNDSVISPIVIV